MGVATPLVEAKEVTSPSRVGYVFWYSSYYDRNALIIWKMVIIDYYIWAITMCFYVNACLDTPIYQTISLPLFETFLCAVFK